MWKAGQQRVMEGKSRAGLVLPRMKLRGFVGMRLPTPHLQDPMIYIFLDSGQRRWAAV